ncbi:hypothetical protein AB0B25_13560 [Nocardia sp. NPDC049190]|uniref:hypothetical protein n=1 Tax=Nocardia sp. NPDC049190 TaxID=3155650 RepID=UPI00340F7197
MSTAISDTITSIGAAEAEFDHRAAAAVAAGVGPGYDSIPRRRRGGVHSQALGSARRSAVDRRPGRARPAGAAIGYDHGARPSAVRRAQGVHPMARVEQAQVGFAVLAVTALLTAIVVSGLIVVAHLRAGDLGGRPEGSVPAVIDGRSGLGGADTQPPR